MDAGHSFDDNIDVILYTSLQEENGRLPRSYNAEDAASLVQLATKINEQSSNKVDLDEVSVWFSYIYALLFVSIAIVCISTADGARMHGQV